VRDRTKSQVNGEHDRQRIDRNGPERAQLAHKLAHKGGT
jgi:hypothetical protein